MNSFHIVTPAVGILLIVYSIGFLSWTVVTICSIIALAVCIAGISKEINQTFISKSTAQLKIKDLELRKMRDYLKMLVLEQRYPKRLPAVFGRTIDDALQGLIDLILRDFVAAWNIEQGFTSTNQLCADVKDDIWKVVQNFQTRLACVDEAKLICDDFVSRVTYHFQRIRQTNEAIELGQAPPHGLPPHLESQDAEIEYLRHIVSALMLSLVPSTYMVAQPVKHVLREFVACKAIQTLTDPDFINQKILAMLSSNLPSRAAQQKYVYNYPESYEEFVTMIQESTDMAVLKQIRYDIVVEIIQASGIHNLKTKTDLSQDGKVKCYISQLSYAKNQCEKRLVHLGWMNQPVEQGVEACSLVHKEPLPLKSVLNHREACTYFKEYLEHLDNGGLVGFWEAVEELRKGNRCYWHRHATEIFYKYIHRPPSSTPTTQPPPIDFIVSKASHKQMEEFLLGNGGPDIFFLTQDKVFKLLEERFYPAFLESEDYQRMLTGSKIVEVVEQDAGYRYTLNGDEPMETSELNLPPTMPDESDYTYWKLTQLQDRLKNKQQALEALRTSLKPDSRILIGLESEVDTLLADVRQMQAHVIHTEEWGKHLGQWRANVSSAEAAEEGGNVQFTLVVHRQEDDDEDAVSTGWVVLRTLQEFHVLHGKLSQLSSTVRTLEVPYLSRKFRITFGHGPNKMSERLWLSKAKNQIQKYLKFILEDEKLNPSEALYTFLSPSSDHLKQVEPVPKKSKFSFSTLFKSNCEGASPSKDSLEDDISLLCDQPEGSRSPGDSKDTIAEPLFGLLNELCDLNKSFKWIRRTLITTIQVTYNRSINRATRVMIGDWFSVQNIYFCIASLQHSWWPTGRLINSVSYRPAGEKHRSRYSASRLLVNNIPLVLSNLVGFQNAELGVNKVFEALQDPKLNKQLFYELLDVFLSELFPEFKTE